MMLKETLIENIKGGTKLKEEAKSVFENLGFPTTKNEEWKYTNLLKWTKRDFSFPISASQLDDVHQYVIDESFDLIVLENGKLRADLSKITQEIIVKPLKQALYADSIAQKHYGKYVDFSNDAMYALNTAMADDGLFIHVETRKVIEKPIQILNITTTNENAFTNPRNLVVIEEGAEVQFIESHYSGTDQLVWNNVISEIVLAKTAHFDWIKIQNDKIEDTALIDSTFIFQEANTVSNVFTFTLGGKLVRNNLNFNLDDEFIEANLSAATLITDKQHADQHTFIDHAYPNCVSNENYKGIYDGSSKGVFNGKVLVRVDAQKTNAYQNNANVILSEKASVDTKPQLEIFADDVKCSHGCTVGHQDDEALFYMRQRGLSRAQAQGILNLAFTGEITDKLRNETVKTYILNLIEEKLN